MGMTQAAAAGRVRALQSLATADGLVVMLEPGPNTTVLDVLGTHISAVRLSDAQSIVAAVDAEAMPGSVGFVCDHGTVSAGQARAFGACGGVIRVGLGDAAATVAERVVELHEAGLAAIVQIDGDAAVGNDLTEQVLAAVTRVAPADPDLVVVPFPVDPSIDNTELWAAACTRVDEACVAPWLLSVGDVPFALGLRQVRAAALGGSSGCVLGPRLWESGDQPADDGRAIDDTLARGLQLIAAQRQALATWDALADDPDAPTASGWFGVRTFVRHGDVSRLEERVVVHRAASADEAIALGQAETDEYASAFDGEAIDAVQVYEMSRIDVVEALGGQLAAGVEVYSQMRPLSADDDSVDLALSAYFD